MREGNGIIYLWYGEGEPEREELPFFYNHIDESYVYSELEDHWKSHYSRSIENQLDVVHLPFVHDTTIGKAVAENIRDLLNGATTLTRTASMGEIGAACVASTGMDIFKGTAATMTVFPVVPDYETYPEYGRDMDLTFGEIGLAGHWMKYLLHHVFIYQAKLRPGWSVLPD